MWMVGPFSPVGEKARPVGGGGGFEGFERTPLRPKTEIKWANQLINQNVYKDSLHSGSQVS